MSTRDRYFNSLEEIYLESYKLVNVFIRDYYSDEEMVREISAVVWLKVAEKSEMYIKMSEYQIQNYLRVVVRTVIVDQIRNENAARELYDKLKLLTKENVESHFSEELTDKEKSFYYRETLKILSYEEKLLLYMRFKEKQSFEELSKVFETSQSTLRMRQSRIIGKLRKAIISLKKENGDI